MLFTLTQADSLRIHTFGSHRSLGGHCGFAGYGITCLWAEQSHITFPWTASDFLPTTVFQVRTRPLANPAGDYVVVLLRTSGGTAACLWAEQSHITFPCTTSEFLPTTVFQVHTLPLANPVGDYVVVGGEACAVCALTFAQSGGVLCRCGLEITCACSCQ